MGPVAAFEPTRYRIPTTATVNQLSENRPPSGHGTNGSGPPNPGPNVKTNRSLTAPAGLFTNVGLKSNDGVIVGRVPPEQPPATNTNGVLANPTNLPPAKSVVPRPPPRGELP